MALLGFRNLPLIRRDDINTLEKCLVTEIRSQNEKCFLTCVYRHPSQNRDEFENFCTNFDTILNNINDEMPLCSIVTGDFNAHNSRWWKNEITNFQGQIMVPMFQFLINAIIISFLERLIFVFLFLQYIFEKRGTIKQQILKILKRQL